VRSTQNNGTLAMTNTVISSAGSLDVNGIAIINGVESSGVIRVNAGGFMATGSAPLVLGAGIAHDDRCGWHARRSTGDEHRVEQRNAHE
jgi:hypothetical protein